MLLGLILPFQSIKDGSRAGSVRARVAYCWSRSGAGPAKPRGFDCAVYVTVYAEVRLCGGDSQGKYRTAGGLTRFY